MTSTRSMSSYKSSNRNTYQKKKQTLEARSNNIWKYSNNPLNIKACKVYPIVYRAAEHKCNYCYSIRTIARKIERIRLVEIAYFNEDFKIPTLRKMIHMTHINVVQKNERKRT